MRGQVADGSGVEAEAVHVDGDFDAAAVWQVGDVGIVADVAVEAEDVPGFAGLDDMGAVFGAAGSQFGGFDGEGVGGGEFFGQHRAVFVVGAGLAPEGGLVAIEVEGLFVFAEVREVFGKVAGAFGHEVAEVAHDFAPDLFVHIEAGPLEVLLEDRVKIAPLMFQAKEPAHVVDACGGEIDLFLGNADIAGNEVHGGLDAVAEADELEAGHAAEGGAAHGHGVGVVE